MLMYLILDSYAMMIIYYLYQFIKYIYIYICVVNRKSTIFYVFNDYLNLTVICNHYHKPSFASDPKPSIPTRLFFLCLWRQCMGASALRHINKSLWPWLCSFYMFSSLPGRKRCTTIEWMWCTTTLDDSSSEPTEWKHIKKNSLKNKNLTNVKYIYIT